MLGTCRLRNRTVVRWTTLFLAMGVLIFCNLFRMLIFNHPELSVQRAFSIKNHTLEHLPTGDWPSKSVHILDLLAQRAPFKFDTEPQELDSSKRYKIVRNFLSSEAELDSQDDGDVCLATQGSLDRLSWLMDLFQLWNGPVSLAVFVANSAQFQAVKVYLSLIRSCSDAIRSNLKVGLVYPADQNLTVRVAWPDQLGSDFSCGNHVGLLKALQNEGKTRLARGSAKQMLYPQNHLRNVARDGCAQKYFFLTDIDVMPKPVLWEELTDFLNGPRTPCEKCVFVVPTYELPETVTVPRTKEDLLLMVKRKRARPFHQKSFIHNQYATNHVAWEALKHRGPGVRAAYKISTYEFFYEPFYVASKAVPRYDERFVGYGFTRNTQVYETHLAGFEFWVLDEAFAVHRGMRNKRARAYWRERQNAINRRRFLAFQKELKLKYHKHTSTKTS